MTDSFIEECDHPVQRQERLAQREGGYKAQKARLPWREGGKGRRENALPDHECMYA